MSAVTNEQMSFREKFEDSVDEESNFLAHHV
jgi:hypothetical protein